MLRPIATPLTLGGFDGTVIDPIASAFRDQGFVPVMAGAAAAASRTARRAAPLPLRPGDPVGVALMSGDLELGATGTVTEVDGNRVYAFGHPFYGLGPTQFPMTRAYVHAVLPSLVELDEDREHRRGDRHGAAGPRDDDCRHARAGPALIPVTLTLTSERGTRKTFNMAMVNDQLFTPLLAYLSILNTLTSYERQNGVGQLHRPRAAPRSRITATSRSRICSPATSRRSARPRTSWRRSTSCCATRSRTSSSKG